MPFACSVVTRLLVRLPGLPGQATRAMYVGSGMVPACAGLKSCVEPDPAARFPPEGKASGALGPDDQHLLGPS